MTSANEKRVFLVCFRAPQVEALQAEGVNVQVLVQLKKGPEGRRPLDMETYDYVSVIERCEVDPPQCSPALPNKLRDQIYDRAYNLFRRHYIRRKGWESRRKLSDWSNFDNLFFLAARFFYEILQRKQITTVIFFDFPHVGPSIVLYHLAKLMDIDVLIVKETIFFERLWIIKSIEDFGKFETVSGEGKTMPLPALDAPFYVKQRKKYRYLASIALRFLWDIAKLILKIFTLRVLWDRNTLKRSVYRLGNYWSILGLGAPGRGYEQDVDLEMPFIYFPLHLQPEMTTDTLGYEYGDQLRALEELSAAAPEGVLIYVKENPLQSKHMREEGFFRRMRLMKNVRYVSSGVPSFELIRRSACVATITGTAGWEAALLQKGVIHFGLAWYGSLPGVFMWQGPATLDSALNFKGDRRSLSDAFQQICRKMYTGVIDHHYAKIVPNFDDAGLSRKAAVSIVSVLRKT